MPNRWIKRRIVVILSGAALLQFVGCGNIVAPAILAVAEQVLFGQLLARLPIF